MARGAALLTGVAISALPWRAGACPDAAAHENSCGDACCAPAVRGGDPYPVSMFENFFDPVQIIIRPASFVRWTNEGLDVHTATRFGMFDSGILDPGEMYDFEFTALNAGLAYSYTCYLHVGMDGVISVARFGDANLDGLVNLQDFNILASNFGTSGPPWEGGDFNEDGFVNLQDFNLLAANFGKLIEPAPDPLVFGHAAAVPEPTTLSLLGSTMILLHRSRRRADHFARLKRSSAAFQFTTFHQAVM